MIEDKTFFSHALEWHLDKYLYPYFSRSVFLICSLLMLMSLIVLYTEVKAWFPLSVQRAVVLVNDDNTQKTLRLYQMSDKYKIQILRF